MDFGAPVTRGDGELVGAVFQVLAGADITDRQENVLFAKGEVVVESLTTSGDDACVTTELLWPGLYEIVELSPPVGYQPNDKPVYVDTGSAAYQYQEAVITYDGLVTNKIRYGAQAIVKALGDDEQDPNHIEQPETGAEFNVYLKRAGSYENARAFERDHLITDKHGYAKTKPLPYGIYVLEQTKGKDGYEIKGPIDFEIDGTEDLINPPPIILSDRPILYRLRIIKTDAQTGKVITLANTSFKLKNAQGEYVTQKVYYPAEGEIDTFTTDGTGTVTLPETVTWGLYYVEEVQSPEGYLLRDEAFAVFVGRDGDKPGETYTLEIEIPNQPVKGHIILEKRGLQLARFEMAMDAYGNEVHSPVYEEGFLAGVVFEVRAADTIIGGDGTIGYQAGELVDTITTSGEGADKSKELPLGKYILTETYAPEGYALDSTPHEVELRFADDQTASVEAVVKAGNDYLPAEITLRKEKESTQIDTHADGTVQQSIANTPGESFVFGLFNVTDIHYDGGTLMADTLVATGATGNDGSLTFPGYYPHGDYYIRELYAPAGWRLNPERFAITLDPAAVSDNPAVIRVSLPGSVHDELIYTRVTITKTDITGERTLPGATIEVINSAGEVIYRAVTDKNGCIPDIPVTPGKYTFREVLAPDGYALNESVMRFEVAEDGTVTGDTTIRDEYTRIILLKQNEIGQPLAGVEFSLERDDGSLILTALSDERGMAVFEKIPYGEYTLRETEPLPGYQASDSVIHLTVDGSFINASGPIATIKNYPNEVIVKKVDQDGTVLAGATFGLFSDDGERIKTAVSDSEGMIKFSMINPGQYVIQETIPPDGYLLSKETYRFTIDKDFKNIAEPSMTFVNRVKRIRCIKKDTSGRFISGVEFSLINSWTGDVVETVISNEQGEFVFTRFDYGDWIIRETQAPEGNNRMDDITLHVDESWTEPEPIICVNIPNHYEFIKTDWRGNPLSGVKFALEDEKGNFICDLTSGEDGVVRIMDLSPGTYVIRETAALDGYTRTDETIQVVINEDYVIPEEMPRLVNYTGIQTGFAYVMTPIMWSGIGLVICAVAMVIWHNATKRRSKRR